MSIIHRRYGSAKMCQLEFTNSILYCQHISGYYDIVMDSSQFDVYLIDRNTSLIIQQLYLPAEVKRGSTVRIEYKNPINTIDYYKINGVEHPPNLINQGIEFIVSSDTMIGCMIDFGGWEIVFGDVIGELPFPGAIYDMQFVFRRYHSGSPPYYFSLLNSGTILPFYGDINNGYGIFFINDYPAGFDFDDPIYGVWGTRVTWPDGQVADYPLAFYYINEVVYPSTYGPANGKRGYMFYMYPSPSNVQMMPSYSNTVKLEVLLNNAKL